MADWKDLLRFPVRRSTPPVPASVARQRLKDLGVEWVKFKSGEQITVDNLHDDRVHGILSEVLRLNAAEVKKKEDAQNGMQPQDDG